MYRKPGANGFEEVTWDFAMERIARLMKDDRDANFIETNNDGVTVNRWPTMGFLSGSSVHQRDRLGDLEGRRAVSGCCRSRTKRGFDTDRRCPVWAQHSVAVQ